MIVTIMFYFSLLVFFHSALLSNPFFSFGCTLNQQQPKNNTLFLPGLSTESKYCAVIGWKYLAISMISVATAMLCKEQGITVTAICAVYEIFVIQKVSFFSFIMFFFCFDFFSFHLQRPNLAIKNYSG